MRRGGRTLGSAHHISQRRGLCEGACCRRAGKGPASGRKARRAGGRWEPRTPHLSPFSALMAPTEPGTGEAPSGKAQSTGQAPSGRLPAEDASLPVYEWERTGEPLGHFQGDSRRSAAVPSAGAALTPRETCLAPPPPGLCTLSPHSGRRPPGVPAPSVGRG